MLGLIDKRRRKLQSSATVVRAMSLAAALAVAGVIAASVLGAPSASCTATQKAQRTAAAAAFAKGMPATRKRYFATHRSTAARKRFVAQQNARLTALHAAAACSVPPATTTATTTTTTTPPPSSLTYVFGSGLDAPAQDKVRTYFDRAAADELALTGVTVSNARVFVSTDAAWLAQQECDTLGYGNSGCYTSTTSRWTSGYSIAVGGPGFVSVYWAAADFQQGAPLDIQKILAHEVFHALQAQLDHLNEATTPPDVVRTSGPVWLNEGAAEYIGYRVAADTGFQAYSTSLAQQKSCARQFGVPLDQLQTYAQPQSYCLFEVAVDHLVAEAPGDVNGLINYYKALGAGTAWPEAFKLAFGKSVEDYYTDFATYRAKL